MERTSEPQTPPVDHQDRCEEDAFALSSERGAWVVEAGHVDVAWRRPASRSCGQPSRPIGRFSVGDVLFACPSEVAESDVEIRVIPHHGARIRRFTASELSSRIANRCVATTNIQTALAGWITKIIGGIQDFDATNEDIRDPDLPIKLTAIYEPGDADSLWRAVTCFQTLVLDTLQQESRQVPDDDHSTHPTHRIRDRDQQQARDFEQSLRRMAEVIDGGPHDPSADRPCDVDGMLAACQLVGSAGGMTFVAPATTAATETWDAQLESICRRSGISRRLVTLAGRWWANDSGPLLVFDQQGNALAALPKRLGGYGVVNPKTGSSRTVDQTLAKSLAAQAVMFYRPLPPKQLGLRDVVSHGLVGQRTDFIRVIVCGLAVGLVGAIIPYASGIIFDTIIPGSQRGELSQLCLVLVASAVAMVLFDLAKSVSLWRIETKSAHDLQAAVWDRLIRLPVPFFRQYGAGDLTMRAYRIDAIRQLIAGTVINSVLNAGFSVFYLALLFFYCPAVAAESLVLVFVALVLVIGLNVTTVKYERRVQELSMTNMGRLLEFLGGIAKIRISGTERTVFSIWGWQFGKQRDNEFRGRAVANLATCFAHGFPILATALIFFQFRNTVHLGDVATGHFIAFFAAFTIFLRSATGLADGAAAMLNVIPLYESVKPILKTVPEVDQQRRDPGQLTGAIELSRVSFRYSADGPLILNGIDFRLKPGEFVALVGPSGSGKSTVLRLLLGFEQPESGAVYFDGQDLTGIDATEVRRQMGVVLQNGKLMPGNVFNNIVGASGTLTMDDAWEAARMAGLAEDIEAMPMGMYTLVSEGGGTLSGGQCQRLLIARAIVKRPSILLMDEATSALDNRSQEIVSRSLERLEVTRIVVAHRLSTIANADRILVIDDGNVVEQGDYRELMDLDGHFAQLAHRQLA